MARYLAGSAFNLGGQPGQQTQTFLCSTSTEIGSPMEPSFALVTGQIFCCSGVRLAVRIDLPEGFASDLMA